MRRSAVPAAPAVLLAALVFLVPVAGAAYATELYFLSPPTSDPTAGGLSTQQPDGNVSTAALVTALPADAASATFTADAGPNATHILGRVLVGLWADVSAASGSVEARFVLVDASGVTPLGSAAQPVSTDPGQVPDPTTLLPPDPTDPEGAVFYALMKTMPLLQHPPVLLDLGVLDTEVPEGSVAGIELRLVDDNSSATGLPASGFAQVSYDALTAPSFVYVPWWSDDPAPSNPSPSPSPSPTPGSSTSSGSGGQDPGDLEQELPDEESPGVGVLAVLGLIGAAMLRRR